MTKFAANNMRIGNSLFALTPTNKLYWLSTREENDLVVTADIKMGFVTSIHEKNGASLVIGSSCAHIAPELDLFIVKGFYWADEWECYEVAIELSV